MGCCQNISYQQQIEFDQKRNKSRQQFNLLVHGSHSHDLPSPQRDLDSILNKDYSISKVPQTLQLSSTFIFQISLISNQEKIQKTADIVTEEDNLQSLRSIHSTKQPDANRINRFIELKIAVNTENKVLFFFYFVKFCEKEQSSQPSLQKSILKNKSSASNSQSSKSFKSQQQSRLSSISQLNQANNSSGSKLTQKKVYYNISQLKQSNNSQEESIKDNKNSDFPSSLQNQKSSNMSDISKGILKNRSQSNRSRSLKSFSIYSDNYSHSQKKKKVSFAIETYVKKKSNHKRRKKQFEEIKKKYFALQ